MHTWHYWSHDTKDSFCIRVLRHEGKNIYNVCSVDTRSNPNAEHDAQVIVEALDRATDVEP